MQMIIRMRQSPEFLGVPPKSRKSYFDGCHPGKILTRVQRIEDELIWSSLSPGFL